MCGVLGLKKDSKFKIEYPRLIELNEKRGKASKIHFTTPQGTFHHFRAPTSGCDLNNLSEAYPLTYKGWGLIGNGVINEKYFKSIKDEDNNNDLYYILKGIVNNGYKFLEGVDGCFGIVVFQPDGTINMVKNTFPIYYSDDMFSSVKFNDSKLLKDGDIHNWGLNSVTQKLKLKNSPFML